MESALRLNWKLEICRVWWSALRRAATQVSINGNRRSSGFLRCVDRSVSSREWVKSQFASRRLIHEHRRQGWLR
jgi:hypothetical protein